MLREAWTLAIETLSWIEFRRLGERLAFAKATKRQGVKNPSTTGLAQKLVFETVRRRNFIDRILDAVLRPKSIDMFHSSVRAFLRLYTYEVKINRRDYEKAARIAGIGRLILGWRRMKEVEESLVDLLGFEPKQVLEGLSESEKTFLQMFQPSWFGKYCVKLLGRHEALRYFESTLSNTPTYVRINTLKAPQEELLEKLNCEGITLEKTVGLQHTYKVVNKRQPLVRTKSFRRGFFYIHDKASSLAVEVAAPRPGMTVLDVCAAPGAKTSYLAQMMENKGLIYSLDRSKRRMRLWKNEIERMGVKIAVPIVGDVLDPLPLRIASVDLAVLDPPCTSTGAFSRTPSSKWRLSKRSVRNMAAIQWKMLNNCAEFVKEGGNLVYSTCSITVEENEILLERFLKWNPEFTMVEAKPRIGLSGLRGQTYSQRLYPHLHECTGFFLAKLTKQV